MLHRQSTDHIRKLVKLLEGKTTDQREMLVTAPPQEVKFNPFATLRGELKELKK